MWKIWSTWKLESIESTCRECARTKKEDPKEDWHPYFICVRVNQSIQLWFQSYKIQQTIAPFEFGTKLSIQFVSIHWIVQLILLFFLDGMQIIKTRQPKFFALFHWSMNSILSLIIHRMPFQISRNGLSHVLILINSKNTKLFNSRNRVSDRERWREKRRYRNNWIRIINNNSKYVLNVAATCWRIRHHITFKK